jgi:hypothetical protein
VEMAIQSLTSIANNQIGPPYEFSCEEMQEEAKSTLQDAAKLVEGMK